MILYGIKNCDTVKKARSYLTAQGIAYQFHDFREDGLDVALLTRWIESVGASALINKRSTTWKQLTAADIARIDNGDVLDICLANPTLIKRPVLDNKGTLTIGFSEKQYSLALA